MPALRQVGEKNVVGVLRELRLEGDQALRARLLIDAFGGGQLHTRDLPAALEAVTCAWRGQLAPMLHLDGAGRWKVAKSVLYLCPGELTQAYLRSDGIPERDELLDAIADFYAEKHDAWGRLEIGARELSNPKFQRLWLRALGREYPPVPLLRMAGVLDAPFRQAQVALLTKAAASDDDGVKAASAAALAEMGEPIPRDAARLCAAQHKKQRDGDVCGGRALRGKTLAALTRAAR